MTYKKHTDDEIITALECCNANITCKGCPLDYLDFSSQCASTIARHSLDIIKRQKAEIEKLTINMNAYGLAAKRLAEEKSEVASEIFAEIEKSLEQVANNGYIGYLDALAELKKKYTEGGSNG